MLKVRVDGEEVVVRDGEVVRIPSGVPHQTEALADTFELDLFSPVREEWYTRDDSNCLESQVVSC
jgi:quercetin dioxygenase-like cupin family protein